MFRSSLFLTLVLSSSFAFAGYNCTAFSTDGASRKFPISIGVSDEYVNYSNQKDGTASKSYTFRADVAVTTKSMDVQMEATGQLGTWEDDTMEESVWTDVTAPTAGYMKLKKVRAAYVGEAVLPFVNAGNPVAMDCRKSVPTRDQCGWFFCL